MAESFSVNECPFGRGKVSGVWNGNVTAEMAAKFNEINGLKTPAQVSHGDWRVVCSPKGWEAGCADG